jgi:uncharacterized membrane protein
MLVPALIVFLPYVITVSLMVVAVLLILKSRRTHNPAFFWLAVAAVVWSLVSHLLGHCPDRVPLNVIQQLVGVFLLLVAVLYLRRTETPLNYEDKFSNSSIEKLQEERAHLETLFADRINFYLVFAAGVLAFLFDEHHKWLETPALVVVVAVSLCMLFTFWRTFRLVKLVLDEICTKHPEAVYSFYAKKVWEVGNANWFLLMLPILLTLYFVYALIVSLCPPSSAICGSSHLPF